MVRGGAHPAKHVCQGSAPVQINTELVLPGSGQMHVRVVEAGHDERPLQIGEPGPGLFFAQDCSVISDG
jgi:hypothetical protein